MISMNVYLLFKFIYYDFLKIFNIVRNLKKEVDAMKKSWDPGRKTF